MELAKRPLSLPLGAGGLQHWLGRAEDQDLSELFRSAAKPHGFLGKLRELETFSEVFGQIRLRSYQREVGKTIVRSILQNLGLSVVVVFPRQTGKNLLQAELEVYLMSLFAAEGAEMVKFSPTFEPQAVNAMQRLEAALEANHLTRGGWKKRAGNQIRFGRAQISFLSAAPASNVVGATASTLLALDEAQDISIEKYDKQIAPMAASTNATRVFWGTAWTDQTLLAREMRAARAAEKRDGIQRVFQISAERVRKEVPAYGAFVDEIVARLGRSHPTVRSQYFGEEIEGAGSLFTAQRLNLMQGSHQACAWPEAGRIYAMLVDLAGEDEALREAAGEAQLKNPGRDSSAVTVVEVDRDWMAQSLFKRPRYKVVCRYLWTGLRQAALLAKLSDLIETWQPRQVVVDGSGVGAGLASFLRDRYGSRVQSLVFNQALKSKLGWGFLSIIDTGRFQDLRVEAGDAFSLQQGRLQAMFEAQMKACAYQVSIGPEKTLHWGVPEGAKDSQTGEALHDDLLISAAMTAVLEDLDWAGTAEPLLLNPADPIREMEAAYL